MEEEFSFHAADEIIDVWPKFEKKGAKFWRHCLEI